MSTAIQQAKERLKQQQHRVPVQVSREAIQYCWFAPMDITHRDQGLIKRLRWTPIVKREKWISIAEKQNPDEFVAVRNLRSEMLRERPLKPPNQGMVWIKPGAIAQSLHLEFGEWGLLVSPTLAKIGTTDDIEAFEQLRLDAFFFPMPEDQLPLTHAECKARIDAVLAGLRSGKLEGLCSASTIKHFKTLSADQIKMILTVGNEMAESVERSRVYQETQLNITHSEFEKAKTETGHRGTYDKRDRLMMEWLQIVPQDEVLNRNAQANTTLIELAKQQLINGNQAQQGIDYEKLGEGIVSGLAKAGLLVKPETK